MPTLDLPPTLPADLRPLEFLAGRWEARDTAEYWVPAGDVWFSVSFGPGDWYEVAKITADDGVVQFVAQPRGGSPTAFPRESLAERDVVFANAAHDFPQRIHYHRAGARMRAGIGGSDRPREQVVYRARLLPSEPVAALVEADRAFYADVAAGGVDAWVGWFDPGGHQWDEDANRAVTPTDGMRELMAGTLAGRLWWDPRASGLSPSGDLGFTVGDWTWTAAGGAEPVARGAYVTVWRVQPDGSWRVWFDGGDPLTPSG